MWNSSQRPGCILALPASQSCQVRSVDEMSAAAADWESPADSRACRISDGDGLFTPSVRLYGRINCHRQISVDGQKSGAVFLDNGACFFVGHFREDQVVFNEVFNLTLRGDLANGGHDFLQLFGLRRATHELNYTRSPCNSKSFLHKFNEALTPPHNAEITGADRRPG